MRLYHFLSKKWGLDDIRERRLKIALIEELNDPFEFFGAVLDDQELRERMEYIKKKFSQEQGLLCFSKNWQNPVQWAHYAKNHTGICLGFDVDDEFISKVEYERKRFLAPDILDNDFLRRSLFTKFYHWIYEQEYRFFTSLLRPKINGHIFYPFSYTLQLKQVIVGCKSDITRSEISEALGDLQNDVEVFKTRPALRSFEVERNLNESLWT